MCRNLNQSRRSSSSTSQHSDDVAVTNAQKQILPLSENTNSRPLPKQKSNDVSCTSTTNEGPQMMQQPCKTQEGQKAMFSQRATNEGPKQTFSDVCTSDPRSRTSSQN